MGILTPIAMGELRRLKGPHNLLMKTWEVHDVVTTANSPVPNRLDSSTLLFLWGDIVSVSQSLRTVLSGSLSLKEEVLCRGGEKRGYRVTLSMRCPGDF